MEYAHTMAWIVRYHQDFYAWFLEQEEGLQDSILFSVNLLEAEGPMLPRPDVDTLKGSRYPNMKELRVQHQGEPWRVIFAFDPKREAILLVGGNKAGNKRWYDEHIPIAERREEDHLLELQEKENNQ